MRTETIFSKALRLAKRWFGAYRSKNRRVQIQQDIVSQIDNWTLLIEFVDRLRDEHEKSRSPSGFNHELDNLAIMLNDQYGATDFKKVKRKKFFFGCSASD